MKNQISIIIHSRNSEKDIEEAIKSAQFLSKNIILVDMESGDRTVELAKELTVQIFTFPKKRYVEPAREFGINKSTTDWVFILDADERITKKLAKEITDSVEERSGKTESVDITHFKIPRKNIFIDRWLKHGGWWPDYQIRLINKKYFKNWPREIHSTPTIAGKCGILENSLVHYFHGDFEQMVNKTVIFEDIESDLLLKAKKPVKTLTFFRKFFGELYRRLIKNFGWFDGTVGVIESIYQAFSKTITYLFLYEKSTKGRSTSDRKKIGLYNPFLDTLGGGEKHILSILEVLAEKGFEINVFWNKDLSSEIKNRFSLQFIDKFNFLPNIFKKKTLAFLTLKTLRILRTFDYFFYVTDGSYFFSSAKKNFVFTMVPDKKLYNLNLLNRLKLWHWQFISNSTFTQKWLKKWVINSQTIYPYIDDRLIKSDINKVVKQPIILSVGRFFSHLHSKRQAVLVNLFKKLKQQNSLFKEFKLIMAGGLKKEDEEYFNQLKSLAKNDSSIIFKTNVSLDELYKLYELSTYFWHFTGLGTDEKTHPEQVEHFGIAPLEAMASGCLTFCYNAGGPKEIIKDGNNGFLFNDEKELFTKMQAIIINKNRQLIIRKNANDYIRENFSYQVFRDRVRKLIIDPPAGG